MAGATVLVSARHAVGVAVCLVLVVVLTGCAGWSTVEGSSRENAEQGIAVSTEYLAMGLVDRALEPGRSFSAESLSTLTEHVLLEPDKQSVEGLRRAKTVYGLSSDADSITIDVYVGTTSSVNAGLYSESTDLFGCGSLRADLVTREVELEDEICPEWIRGWGGDDTEETSLEETITRQGGKTTWGYPEEDPPGQPVS